MNKKQTTPKTATKASKLARGKKLPKKDVMSVIMSDLAQARGKKKPANKK